MNVEQAQRRVRTCLQQVCPDFDFAEISDHTELLRERVITSFQVIDLILHLEHERGRQIERRDLEPGCFRNITTIAQRFFLEVSQE
jgi:acyl carrier protein